jgi:hypothetical protein
MKAAFAQGWYDGALGIAPNTAREVAKMYPHLTMDQIDVYLNGAEDGRRSDRWRLDDSYKAYESETRNP